MFGFPRFFLETGWPFIHAGTVVDCWFSFISLGFAVVFPFCTFCFFTLVLPLYFSQFFTNFSGFFRILVRFGAGSSLPFYSTNWWWPITSRMFLQAKGLSADLYVLSRPKLLKHQNSDPNRPQIPMICWASMWRLDKVTTHQLSYRRCTAWLLLENKNDDVTGRFMVSSNAWRNYLKWSV